MQSKLNKKKMIIYFKEDAYGVGIKFVLDCCYSQGIREFLFGSTSEAIFARQLYPDIVAYVYNTFGYEIDIFYKYSLIPVVHDFQQLEQFKSIPIILHVTLSLASVGFSLEEFKKINLKEYNIRFIMSHLAWSYEENSFQNNKHDIALFQHEFGSLGYKTSLCSSRGFLAKKYLNENSCKCNITRVSHALFGDIQWLAPEFKPVIQEISFKIVHIKQLPINSKIGYGHNIISKEKYMGYINVGYINGFGHSFKLYYGDKLQDSILHTPANSTMSLTWVPLKYPVDRVYVVHNNYGKRFSDLGGYKWSVLTDFKKSNQVIVNYL